LVPVVNLRQTFNAGVESALINHPAGGNVVPSKVSEPITICALANWLANSIVVNSKNIFSFFCVYLTHKIKGK
jgi:hypothetical protein